MTLVSITELVAENELRCDASADLVDQLYKTSNDKFRSKHLPVAFQVRKCKILEGQKYKVYTLVDDEAELHEFKCVSKLDDYMKRNNLYPEFLLDLIKNNK